MINGGPVFCSIPPTDGAGNEMPGYRTWALSRIFPATPLGMKSRPLFKNSGMAFKNLVLWVCELNITKSAERAVVMLIMPS